jgi:hypothetical protein
MSRSHPAQPDPDAERSRRRHDRNQQHALQSGQTKFKEVFDRDTIEELTGADWPEGGERGSKRWLRELMEGHLTKDQVLAILDDRDLHAREWTNPNIAEDIIMSFPPTRSRTDSDRVRRVRNRIRGDDKDPLSSDQKREIRAAAQQKTDRETRAKDGRFTEYLLGEVVESKEHSDGSQSESLWGRLLG